MREFKWSPWEKAIARTAFDQALIMSCSNSFVRPKPGCQGHLENRPVGRSKTRPRELVF
jgi:hypothetical protein